jgi:hypothetical protein
MPEPESFWKDCARVDLDLSRSNFNILKMKMNKEEIKK